MAACISHFKLFVCSRFFSFGPMWIWTDTTGYINWRIERAKSWRTNSSPYLITSYKRSTINDVTCIWYIFWIPLSLSFHDFTPLLNPRQKIKYYPKSVTSFKGTLNKMIKSKNNIVRERTLGIKVRSQKNLFWNIDVKFFCCNPKRIKLKILRLQNQISNIYVKSIFQN